MDEKSMYPQGKLCLVGIGWVVFSYLAINLFTSCNQKSSIEEGSGEVKAGTIEEYLIEFNNRYSSIDTSGWEVELFYETSNDVNLDIFKKVNDTSHYAELYISKYDSTMGEREEKVYYVLQYIKSYLDSRHKHFIFYKNGKDTLYYYKAPLNDLDNKIFVMGKYQYQYTFPMLDSSQAKYYLQHKDSLDMIRGNDLPPLPSALD